MPKLDPIELTVNLPPDGTYPPRIVLPNNSIWLHDNTEVLEFPEGVFIQVTNGQCTIYQEDDRADIRVNNQILIGRRVLKDGDFIHSQKKKIRAIFQADPVADYRNEWTLDGTESTSTIQLTDQLAKHVVINAEGMSLDGGKTFAQWDTIQTLFISWTANSKWGIQILATNTVSQDKTLLSKSRSVVLNDKEFQTLLTWIIYSAPFGLSLLTGPPNIGLPDAYAILAHRKILTPAKERKRDLPATPAFILDLESRRTLIIDTLKILAYLLIPSLIIWGIIEEIFHIASVYLFGSVYLLLLLLLRNVFRNIIFKIRHTPEWESLELPPRLFGVEDIVDERQGEHAS